MTTYYVTNLVLNICLGTQEQLRHTGTTWTNNIDTQEQGRQ